MKVFKYIAILFLGLATLSSCEKDESLDPVPLKMNGKFVKLDLTSDRMDFNNLSGTYFGGTLSTPVNNVARYELFVRREVGSQVMNDYVLLTTITSFPAELRVTPQMIADALGISVSSMANGDFYRFYAYSYDVNGVVTTYRDLGRNAQTERTLKQAYRFRTLLTDNLTGEFNIYN